MIETFQSGSCFRGNPRGNRRIVFLFALFFLCSGVSIYAIDDFKFRKNDRYDIEYLSGENKTVVLTEVYYRDEWWVAPHVQEKTDYSDTRRIMERRMRFLEFLKVYEDGKREVHLIRFDQIIRITQVIKDSSSRIRRPSTSSSARADDKDLKINFSE